MIRGPLKWGKNFFSSSLSFFPSFFLRFARSFRVLLRPGVLLSLFDTDKTCGLASWFRSFRAAPKTKKRAYIIGGWGVQKLKTPPKFFPNFFFRVERTVLTSHTYCMLTYLSVLETFFTVYASLFKGNLVPFSKKILFFSSSFFLPLFFLSFFLFFFPSLLRCARNFSCTRPGVLISQFSRSKKAL